MELRHGMTRPRVILVLALGAAALAAGLLLPASRGSLETRHEVLGQKIRLAADMRAELFASAQSEKSAVLAETDEASQAFAREATAAADRVAAALERLKTLGEADARELALVGEFATAFAAYRKADAEILALAVENTNLKALALSFGPATRALADLERALGPLSERPEARIALAEVLRIQSLHAPHIMEKTEARMDSLEREMAHARKAAAAALSGLPEGPDRAAAQAALERHAQATAEVILLSRRNSNVRSLALSLERKTKVQAECLEPLRALEDILRRRQDSRATR